VICSDNKKNSKKIKGSIILKFFVKWLWIISFSSLYAQEVQFLNNVEKEYFHQRNLVIKIGITQIPNQVLKTDNGYKGYVIDLYNLIGKRLGINFEFVYFPEWKDVLQAAKEKKIDIVFLAQKTKQRLEYLEFTDVVLRQHNKILTNAQYFQELEVEDLFGKKVGIVKDSAIAEFVTLNYPQIQPVFLPSEQAAIQAMLTNTIKYAIVEPVRISYYIKKNNYDNLYVSGDFPYEYKLRIATRKDLPILNIILNKTLDSISPAEKKALALKWGYEKETPILDTKLLIEIFIVFIVIVSFLIYLYVINRKLKTTQKELQKVNTSLQKRVAEEVEKNRQKELIILQQDRFAQMGQLIQMITHQWKQPLDALGLLIQTYTLQWRKEQKVDLSTVEEFKDKSMMQIRQMSKTIDDFQSFFKTRKERTKFYYDELIDNLLYIIEPFLEQSGIKLEFKKKKRVTLYGYPNELAQALINIIYNAKDAFDEQKNMQEKKITISLEDKENSVVLEIADTAGGIDQDIVEKIFEPYFSTKGKKGSGVGLYMAKTIIQQRLGGRISVKNAAKGAVFKIVLPKM